ncbi:SMP-30/gluconolactonase/LRE family protein [Rubrivirga sp. S365]|uniref:SMP-30/gluconolactonase/LRE family protein n=1 Tax=Rubrivirga sp. S365 TaxID=3076080 RepID=UPI0028CAC22D|nr:SMP-30/gluconolactonase/LRE family protein [Rubrivirga sp. S365]MDT7856687.1 SMP-30/gluconolactonase/LRE family protein [Rubrivirga sp. S365]
MVLHTPTVVAENFCWVEGPLWVDRLDGLLVSDVKANTIFLLRPPVSEGGAWTREVFLRPSGTSNPHPPGEEHGANGLSLDADGRLLLCSHGERGVFVLDEERWTRRPLVTRVRGRRLNSPNDVTVCPASGAAYLTDPPFGLDDTFDDPRRETDVCGIYRVDAATGAVTLASDALHAPNGIAFSPDGRTAYATNSKPPHGRYVAFDVGADGTFGPPRTLLDTPDATYETGMPDGLAVASDGTVVGGGPGGVYVFSPEGEFQERVDVEPLASNVAFGRGGRSLFVTAGERVVRFEVD